MVDAEELRNAAKSLPQPVERIDDSEQAVLRAALARQQRYRDLAAEAAAAIHERLTQRYKLTPADRIHPDGRIERGGPALADETQGS